MESIIHPLYLSLKIAVIATTCSLILGTLCAWLFSRWKNRWTETLSLLSMLPLLLPPTVVGYYLLLLIGRNSTLGQFIESLTGQPLMFTWKAAVIAATVAAFPLVVRPIQTAFEEIDREVITAAMLDGANQWKTFQTIILPLSYKGIMTGMMLGFSRAMGEFGATLMVAGNIPGQTQTLSIAIYDAIQGNRMSEAHYMAVVLSVMTLLFLFIMTHWLKR